MQQKVNKIYNGSNIDVLKGFQDNSCDALIAQKPHGKAKYKQALNWYYERKELLDKGIPEEDLSLYTKNARVEYWKQQKNGVKSASVSISNVSASRGKNEVKEKQDIQGNLF